MEVHRTSLLAALAFSSVAAAANQPYVQLDTGWRAIVGEPGAGLLELDGGFSLDPQVEVSVGAGLRRGHDGCGDTFLSGPRCATYGSVGLRAFPVAERPFYGEAGLQMGAAQHTTCTFAGVLSCVKRQTTVPFVEGEVAVGAVRREAGVRLDARAFATVSAPLGYGYGAALGAGWNF